MLITEPILILAADDGAGQVVKIVIGLAAAALWVLAQLASSWSERQKKKQQKLPRPPAPDYNDLPVPQRTEVPPRRPQQHQPPPRQPQSTSRRQQQKQQQKQQRQRATSAPPPLQMPPRQAPVVFEEPTPTGSAVYKARDPDAAAAGPNRRDRLKSILRPRNLKKEFILTEILQPPLAMRERPEIQ